MSTTVCYYWWMKIFVTGQWDSREEIQDIYKKLQAKGHMITHDWTVTDSIGDHKDNNTEAGLRAAKDLDGVIAADTYIFVANHSKPGRAMYAELGAALASSQLVGRPKVYVIGKLNYPSVFYFHPSVTICETIDDVLPV